MTAHVTPHFSRLQLTLFRNYTQMAVNLEPCHVVLTGANGAGKTNLMEAVSLFTPGRGLRRAALNDIAHQRDPAGFGVFAKLETRHDSYDIGTGTAFAAPAPAEAAPIRRVRINGTNAKSTDELLDLCRIIWLTPSMDGLFTGPAGDRRRFLDRMVLAIDPMHGRRANDYEKAMRARNRLLEQPVSSQSDAWLNATEAQLAAFGTAIIAARTELLELLRQFIEATVNADDRSSFPTAGLTLDGALETWSRTGLAAAELEQEFARQLRDMRYRDRAAKRTLIGPHRTDLLIRHREKDMDAALCSTGEQKALLVGLVLAHAALTRSISGHAPIMLLDEIAAHLDENRRGDLFDRVHALGGQAFMTGTDRNLFDALEDRAQYLRVDNGQITRAD